MADMNLRSLLENYRYEHSVLQKEYCTPQEMKEYSALIKEGEPLPEGIYQYKSDDGTPLDSFYRIHKTDLSREELAEYFMYKNAKCLNTIKNCAVFFTSLTVISLIVYLFILLLSL